ncbi:hypothetical protein LCGC14_2187760, partial [marine sediment metagenome]
PRDGWRVKEFAASTDDTISLWLEFVQDGVPQGESSFCLRYWPQDTSVNSGQRERLRAAVTAIARYANLGGELPVLEEIIADELHTEVKDHVLPKLPTPKEIKPKSIRHQKVTPSRSKTSGPTVVTRSNVMSTMMPPRVSFIAAPP